MHNPPVHTSAAAQQNVNLSGNIYRCKFESIPYTDKVNSGEFG